MRCKVKITYVAEQHMTTVWLNMADIYLFMNIGFIFKKFNLFHNDLILICGADFYR